MKIEVIEVKPVPPPKEYILRLDQVELDIVVSALGKCGGYDGPLGYREVLNKIYNKLALHQVKKDVINFHGMSFDGLGNRVAYPK